MNTVLAVAGGIVGLLPFLFSPTRTFARGGAWRYAGAALIIASMMLLFFDVRDMTGGNGDDNALAAVPSLTDADISALESVFGG